MTGITDGYILLESDPIIGQDVYHSFLTDYCGLDYEAADGEEKERLMEMPEVQSMGYWPEENSVRVIDDTVVVWLGGSRFNRQ